jgi:exopolysaccharide biosynthesis protein
MIKIIKHSCLVMIAALVLFSCSKNEDTPDPEVPKEEVVLVDKNITAITKKIMDNSTVIKTFISDTTIKIAEGLHRTSIKFKRADELPVAIFILEADLKNAKLEMQTITPYNDLIYGLQPISQMARDNEKPGTKIMAAINGSSYTAAGDPTGVYYVNGLGIKTTVPTTGTFFAYHQDKSTKIGGKDLKGVQRNIDYSKIKEAVGGTSWFVDNGVKATYTDVTINARTAIGYNSDRVVYAIVVDGGQTTYSNGLSLAHLRDIIASLGVTDAINLDGAGSSTLAIRDGAQKQWNLLNKPSGQERSVANGLAFVVKD